MCSHQQYLRVAKTSSAEGCKSRPRLTFDPCPASLDKEEEEAVGKKPRSGQEEAAPLMEAERLTEASERGRGWLQDKESGASLEPAGEATLPKLLISFFPFFLATV